MDNCIKHDLPFDEMGYCQPPDGEMSCSGWLQMTDRIAELEKELEEYRCLCRIYRIEKEMEKE